MPCIYQIETELGLILYTGFGVVTGAELVKLEETASQDPMRLANMKILVDLSEMELDISMNDIYQTITVNRTRMEKGKDPEPTAFVSTSRFAETLAGIFSMFGDGVPLKFRLFTTVIDAIKWLDLLERTAEIQTLRADLIAQLKKTGAG